MAHWCWQCCTGPCKPNPCGVIDALVKQSFLPRRSCVPAAPLRGIFYLEVCLRHLALIEVAGASTGQILPSLAHHLCPAYCYRSALLCSGEGSQVIGLSRSDFLAIRDCHFRLLGAVRARSRAPVSSWAGKSDSPKQLFSVLPFLRNKGYALADTGIIKFICPFRLISDTHSATVLVEHPN
ncbi:hypothetical protein D3C76_665800 [compost metagenome]